MARVPSAAKARSSGNIRTSVGARPVPGQAVPPPATVEITPDADSVRTRPPASPSPTYRDPAASTATLSGWTGASVAGPPSPVPALVSVVPLPATVVIV